ncbi:dipeptidase [Montanilutibacter psychrotolerans]|uniref:Membrane dipeptidase n=1 Tax=Montanilutibacter psychrotolerans TaxID=1327343 RepID=A0A3M8SMW2_9GAMM|nr:dipeptidase [Lysobacter psychrotolerans]RNF82671.1 membrane dipeptidase [Lysobacter psychrotolerans]
MRIPSVLALSLSLIAMAAQADDAPEAARALAQDAIVVDTHIDAPSVLVERWGDIGRSAPDREFDYPRARRGGLDVAFMSIYTAPSADEDGTARQRAHAQIDAVEAAVARHPDRFAMLHSPRDLKHLRSGGRVLLALGMENGAPIGEDLEQLTRFHARGVRYITLAHSANNRISDSSYALEKRWGGLSPFGERVVARMNQLGIMVDVSHLSDDAVSDVLAISTVPVIASHSGMRHFTPGFERNLSDELANSIAAKGGVVQLVFGNGFVNPKAAADMRAYFPAAAAFQSENAALAAAGKPQRPQAAFDEAWELAHPVPETDIAAVLDQIDHAVRLLGADHVGIGSDFDGVGGALPTQLRSVADYPNLVAGLQARGHSDADIRKILGGNLLRVWRAVEDAAVR